MKKLLEELKKIAINFQIKPIDSGENVVSVDTLIKVLSDIKKSFYHFAEFEFLNNRVYSKYLEKNPKLLQQFLDDFQLMIVDAKIGSYQSALAPDVTQKQDPFFKDDVLEFKRTTFENYKDDVAFLDYQDQKVINSVVAKYPEEHRVKFYRPFLDAVSEEKKYNIFLLDAKDRPQRKIIAPDLLRKKQLIPVIKQSKPEQQEQLIRGYFRISSDGKKIELKKSNIRKIYDLEILDHDTYPYKPDTIRFEHHTFVLNEKLHCEVDFEEDQYFIINNELDITVWGDNREEVENAFCFSFYSLYKNYAEESDENLSPSALEFKKKLLLLIKAHHNEA